MIIFCAYIALNTSMMSLLKHSTDILTVPKYYFDFSALVTAYEKAKKKHQSRLKKLEAQMMAMVERHDTQVNNTPGLTAIVDIVRSPLHKTYH